MTGVAFSRSRTCVPEGELQDVSRNASSRTLDAGRYLDAIRLLDSHPQTPLILFVKTMTAVPGLEIKACFSQRPRLESDPPSSLTSQVPDPELEGAAAQSLTSSSGVADAHEINPPHVITQVPRLDGHGAPYTIELELEDVEVRVSSDSHHGTYYKKTPPPDHSSGGSVRLLQAKVRPVCSRWSRVGSSRGLPLAVVG